MKAFPTDYFYDDETKHEILPSEGMDLRDYFAAKALVGFIQASSRGVTNFAEVSSLSYKIADAMMKARETK